MSYADTFLNENGVFVLGLLLAMFLGSLIGLERQLRGRPAGLRTNILVCLGSAAIIVAFQKLSLILNVGSESAIRMDPARAAAGVITGIGFLGAGTIVKSNDFVRGLTTAASIWIVSAVGITVGLGEYVISMVLTFFVLLSLYVLHRLPLRTDHYFNLQLKWKGSLELLDEIIELLKKNNAVIKHQNVMSNNVTGVCKVRLRYRIRISGAVNPIFQHLKDDKRFDEILCD